jgi:tetratricopeptide (TPR) repeat protein
MHLEVNMRLATIIIIVLSVAFSSLLFSATDYTDFNKGIAYILIKDKGLAVKHMEDFFKIKQDPALRVAFINLIEANDWEVTKEFKRYLDINHRSTPALVGIALSTTDMENSTSIDNLVRATRLERNFSAAYLALGMEYQKRKNYPLARANYATAIRYSRTPEYKILLAQLLLKLGDAGGVLNLIKPEADRHPDNFYFNYFTAESYYRLQQLEGMGKYIETAIETNPGNNDAKLLLAKYQLSQKDLKQSRATLRKISFRDYNEDYARTFAEVLMQLKDKQAKSYLDEVYSREKWDKDINRLMGQYYVWQREKGNVQNWINRSVLSGNDVETLKSLFSSDYKFPAYKNLPFFEVHGIYWLSDELLLVAAVRQSGDRGALYVLQAEDLKIVKTLPYLGRFLNLEFSQDRDLLMFATSAVEKQSVYVYAVTITERNYVIRSLYSRPLNMPGVIAGFNRAGTLLYFTNDEIMSQAFISPFTKSTELGQKEPIYNDYPYPIYKYNFGNSRLTVLKDIDQMRNVPIDGVRKYFRIYDTTASDSEVGKLVSLGQRQDVTSSSVVKMFFADNIDSFMVYLSDLKNAFQARLIDEYNRGALNIDETMFLGKDSYAHLEMVEYDPENREIVVITKDNDRTLIKFNYRSLLFTRLADKVLDVYYDKDNGVFYVLTELSKKRHFTASNLEVIYLKPYYKHLVDERRDLTKIHLVTDSYALFSTIEGEMLKMTVDYQFNYVGPALDGCLNATSPSGKIAASFINGKLFLIDLNQQDDTKQWERKQNSQG